MGLENLKLRYDCLETGAYAKLRRSAIGSNITLHQLYVPHRARRDGIATRLLKQICSDADLDHVNLQLVIIHFNSECDPPLSETELSYMEDVVLPEFYSSFGFRRLGGWWIRTPNQY